MNEFVFTTMRHIFVRFFEEIEDTKNAFRNYLTIKCRNKEHVCLFFLRTINPPCLPLLGPMRWLFVSFNQKLTFPSFLTIKKIHPVQYEPEWKSWLGSYF